MVIDIIYRILKMVADLEAGSLNKFLNFPRDIQVNLSGNNGVALSTVLCDLNDTWHSG